MLRVAIDCEMVGALSGKSLLARVSIVDETGKCVFDEYVIPRKAVHDYRTAISGITASDLINAKPITEVHKKVAKLIHGKILVGHSVNVDLAALGLSHPKKHIRDVAKYPRFVQDNDGKKPSLRDLAAKELGWSIQGGPHSSVKDAKAAMMLYNKVAATWQ